MTIRSRRAALALLSAGLLALAICPPAGASAATSGWSRMPVPKSVRFAPGFNAVTCADPTSCWFGTVARTPLVRYHAGTWSTYRATTRTDLKQQSINSISCSSATSCLAVGNALSANGLVLRAAAWNGTKWSDVSPASSQSGSFEAVACASPVNCIAVGDLTTSMQSTTTGTAWRWNGSHWTAMSLPAGVTPNGSSLTAVACPVANNCMAIGSAADSHGNAVPLSLQWTNARWVQRAVPAPASFSVSGLVGLACPSETSCFASGIGDATQVNDEYFVRWNGTNWTGQTVPKLVRQSQLVSLSCASTSSCLAVGYALVPPPGVFARWDGQHWTASTISMPAEGGQLFDVSCPRAGTCIATGYQNTRSGQAIPLVERYSESAS